MLKALKLRNIVFFVCIVTAIASVSVVTVLGLIVGGQQAALNAKNSTLGRLSDKLSSYEDLGDFLTIKNQVSNIDALSNNKKVISRTFGVLSAIIPTGADTITISKLDVDLVSEEQPTLSFEAQANAGKEPYIDYNVLDSFKKSMQFMHYDYGNYVDRDGETIPAYCMIESGQDGVMFSDSERGAYALWTIDAEGCISENKDKDYDTEMYDGQRVVKVWRTPQVKEWYKETKENNQPYMGLDGEMSGVPHFESECIRYIGVPGSDGSSIEWSYEETCMLVPDGSNGMTVTESSNGRDSSGELVLRFSATIALDSEVYKFVNHHMAIIPPTGRRNVTDSYVQIQSQIQSMFGERAQDCDKNDEDCKASNKKKGDE